MKSNLFLFGRLTIAICIILQLRPCSGATWEGTDDFAGGVSPSKWTIFQNSLGSMNVQGANGHASYLVAGSTSSEQQAIIIWNGAPSANSNWSVEITGHNSASWSGNGGSQLQLYLIAANDATLSQAYRIAFARSAAGTNINAGSGGASFSIPTTTTDAHLRLVYKAATRTVQSWCAMNAAGTNWTILEDRSVDQIMPLLSATNVFRIGIFADTYYGPITEGQIWADNFLLTNAISASRISLVKALKPTFSNLSVGASYQMQVSSDMASWTNYGNSFVATNVNMIYPQYFDVPNWNSLFFQLQAAP